MKPLYFILLLLPVLSCTAGETTTHSKKFDLKRLSVGVSVSPDVCGATYRYKNARLNVDDGTRAYTPQAGYTVGVFANYKLKQWLSIEGGIQYSNRGMVERSVSGATQWSQWDGSPQQVVWQQYFHFIDLPLLLRFSYPQKKVRLCGSVGFATNILLAKHINAIYDNGMSRMTLAKRGSSVPANLSAMMSIGMEYQFNPQMAFRIEPAFRHAILKTMSGRPYTYLWSAGLNLGLCFGVK